MGRDEVLQYVQAFTEVGRDRGFNNRAVRLRHQAAHAGQLTDLRCRTTGTRVGHHINRIERFLLNFFTGAVYRVLRAELIHHGLSHDIAGTRPNIHHLVVAFAICDQAGSVLAFNLLNLFFGARNNAGLLQWDQHVVDTE